MNYQTLSIQTQGEGFYDITKLIKDWLMSQKVQRGDLKIFLPHTSCGLCINEAFDPSACQDMENFLKHLAPRNLSFIKHTAEGEDDSPSHMKSILLQNTLEFFIEDSKILLGQWQGIYLCEFRDLPKERSLHIKAVPHS